MERKPIQVDDRTHEIIRLEAARQSTKPNNPVFICDVVAQFAEKLNKKHHYISPKRCKAERKAQSETKEE